MDLKTILPWLLAIIYLGIAIFLYQNRIRLQSLMILDHPNKVYCGYIVGESAAGGVVVKIANGFRLFALCKNKLKVLVTNSEVPEIGPNNMYMRVCFSDMHFVRNRFLNRQGIFIEAHHVVVNDCQSKNHSLLAYMIEDSTFNVTHQYYAMLRFFYNLKTNLFLKLSIKSDPTIIGIIFGILLGDNRFIDNYTYMLFKKTGLIHIMVVSGYNIVVFVSMIDIVMANISIVKIYWIHLIKLFIVTLLILMVGPSPSVLRAFGFWVVGSIFRILGIRITQFAKLYYTAIYMFIIIDPFWIFNISALLSFLASLGVIYLSPIVYGIPFIKRIGNVIAETVGAMFATTPLLFITFGYIPSLYIFLANVLILPYVEIVTMFGYFGLLLLFVPRIGELLFFYTVVPLFGVLLFMLSIFIKILKP